MVFWAGCTLGLEALGSVGALSLGPMLAWGVMVGAIGGVLRWFRAEVDPDPVTAAQPASPFPGMRSSRWRCLLTAALVLGMRSLLLAVKVVSDGPIYHLYFAARWWKAGRLFLVASPFGENAATYFPANGDLWFTWLMASWGGDRLAKVGQVPFLVLACMAAFGCAARLGRGPVGQPGRDLLVRFVDAAAALLVRAQRRHDLRGGLSHGRLFLSPGFARRREIRRRLCLGALAAGEALGTKAVGVVFVPPLLALAVVGILVQAVPARTKIVRTLVIVLVPLVSGGFWYIRNALLTGNPLYPLEVRLLGRTLLHGWYLSRGDDNESVLSAVRGLAGPGRYLAGRPRPQADAALDRLRWSWAGRSRTRRPTERGAWIAIFSFMAVLNVVLYWVCIPYRTQQRFMLQALGLAVVPLAITLDRFRWLRHAAAVCSRLHLLTPQGWPFALA